MKKLDKKGMASFGMIFIITVPGALTTFIIYKVVSKLSWLKTFAQEKLLLQKHS